MKRVKLHLPADWALRHRAATHKNEKDKRAKRNSKIARRELRATLEGD